MRGRISEVLSHIGDAELKGEVVVVIDGEHTPETPDLETCADEAQELVDEGMRKRDAAHAVAERHDVSARQRRVPPAAQARLSPVLH